MKHIFICCIFATVIYIMDIFQDNRLPALFRKERPLKKHLFIFIYGSLVFGGSTALLSSLLIELSYQPNELPLFSMIFVKRFCVSLPVFMVSGTAFGHWRLTSRRQKRCCLSTASTPGLFRQTKMIK